MPFSICFIKKGVICFALCFGSAASAVDFADSAGFAAYCFQTLA